MLGGGYAHPFLAGGPGLSAGFPGCPRHTGSQWEAVSWEFSGGREALQTRGGDRTRWRGGGGDGSRDKLSLPRRVYDPRQPHTNFPGNEKGVRKCNFSVWLLTDSLRRFLLGCGIECLPSPTRDGGPRISEFRCLLGKSCQEEVESDMCVPEGWDFRTQR